MGGETIHETRRGPREQKKKVPGGSAQAIKKARFGQGNPRKSKPFSWIYFALAWVDFAGFGQIWNWLGKAWPQACKAV
jgi:hypothetical protein